MAKSKIDAATFVEAWESSENVAEVAKKLGLKIQGVRSRAAYYRKQQVLLKPFARVGGGKKLDVAALNAIILKKRPDAKAAPAREKKAAEAPKAKKPSKKR